MVGIRSSRHCIPQFPAARRDTREQDVICQGPVLADQPLEFVQFVSVGLHDALDGVLKIHIAFHVVHERVQCVVSVAWGCSVE